MHLYIKNNEFGHHELFNVHALSFGYNYDLLYFNKTRLAVGGNFTINESDAKLDDLYGKNPLSFQLYFRLYPGLMKINR